MNQERGKILRSPDADEPSQAHRPASVTLREEGARSSAAMMDPANQSLADALRITFGILQGAMLILAVLFVISGVQSINVGEQGVRLLFGRITGRQLEPGVHFSAPFPLGEIIRVETGMKPVTIEDSFWYYLSDTDKQRSVEDLSMRGNRNLDPERDGSVLTADGNIAHTRWKAAYVCAQPAAFSQNINDEFEQSIVEAAIERAIVHAVAQTNIDDLLKQSQDEKGSVALRARAVAQQALDRIGSGLVITQLALEQRVAPLRVFSDFTAVQTAQQDAAKAADEADAIRRQILNETAGEASPYLIAQINLYEEAVELGNIERQESVLATINSLLERRAVEIDGQEIGPVASGLVTSIIDGARQYRTRVVSERRSDLAQFQAKLAQFRTNPTVVVQRDWADALKEMYTRDLVELLFLPPQTTVIELLLSRDPDIRKEWEKAEKFEAAEAAAQERRRRQRMEQFKTDTDSVLMRSN